MSCVVKDCTSHWRMKEISLHRIPKHNFEPWFRALGIRKRSWELNRNKKVCSLHFNEQCFDRTGQNVRLKPGSVPTLNLGSGDEGSSSSTETVVSETVGQHGIFEKPDVPELGRQPRPISSQVQHSSSSVQTSSTESTIARRRKFVQIIHNYSCSPGKYKRKFSQVHREISKCRKRLTARKASIKKLKVKIQSLTQVIKLLSKSNLISQNASEHLEVSLTGFPKMLFNRLLKNAGKKTLSREQYAPEIQQFAMTLQFYSSKAYDYVRESLNLSLPHPSTVRSWYSGFECNPGFTKGAFDALHLKAQEKSRAGQKLICSLIIDEMSIKKQIESEGEKIWGYIDLGADVSNDSLTPASEALVFMVVCHTEAWKLPVAYFLIKSLTGEEKSNLIGEVLKRLYLAGVKVTSVTCDGPSAHFTMMRNLGCEITDVHNISSHFAHPMDGSRIYAIFDNCHMIKLMRNCLATLEYIVDPDGNIIQWRFIAQLYVLQQKEGLTAGNKLKKAHMEWEKQKMKVRLAVQTLSRSVADALEFLMIDLNLPEFQGAEATINFIRIVDSLFDILNSRSPHAKGLKGPLRQSNEDQWRPFLINSVDYLKNCKNMNGQPMYSTSRKTAFIGFIVSSLSVIGLYDDYVKSETLKYVLTYKCSQDHLEMFFCSIRSRNGWNNNPSALQFKNSYKRLLYHAQVKGVGGNCAPLDTTTILSINTGNTVKKSGMPGFKIDFSVLNKFNFDILGSLDHDYHIEYSPGLTDFVENVVSYISGYVLKMLPKYIKCTDCLEVLVSERKSMDDTSLLLLKRKDRGGLLWASDGVRKVCKKAEAYIRRMLIVTNNKVPREERYIETCVNIVSMELYSLNLFPQLENHYFDSDFSSNHVYLLIKTIAYCYLKIRLFNLCKRQTEEVQGTAIRQQLSKLILFSHQ